MAELITLDGPDGTIEAYLNQGGTKGGVLFFMDAIGLRPRIGDMVDEIASWGYTVLAPHVFYREGSADQLRPHADLRVPENREAFFSDTPVIEFVANLTPERAAADTAVYVEKLRSLLGPDAKIGTTGYCMGARLAVRAGGQFPGVVVAVGGFHGGGLVTDEADSPHTRVSGEVEYVFGHADNDRSMTPEHVQALGEALDAAGATYTQAIYPGVPHGYTMADTSMWHEAGYERHLTELKALLERRLG